MKGLIPLCVFCMHVTHAFCQVQDTLRLNSGANIRVQEVEVSAHTVDKDLTASAPTYTLVQEDFLKQGVTDIADLMRRLPGVTLKDYGGAGGMKTVSVRGLGSQHTGVTYDGIMLSDCQTGEIDLQRYTLNDISSIGLTIGDGSDIFQPARNMASAATINVKTLPSPPFLGRGCKTDGSLYTLHSTLFTLTTGSWGYVNPSAEVWNRVTEKLTLGGAIDYIHAENDYPFTLQNIRQTTTQDRTNSRMNQWHGELNMLWGGLTCKLYYYDNDRQLPGAVHYYVNDNDETLRERNAFGQAQWKGMLNDKFALKLSGKWNWASSDYHNGKPSGGITSNEYWQREGYMSGALLFEPTAGLTFDYSADYIYNSLNDDDNDNAVPEPVEGDSPERHSILQALAAKYQDSRFGVTGHMVVGIYKDKEAGGGSKHEQQFSPSVSMSYKIWADKEFYLRASWKETMRMPSFRELYYFHMGDSQLSPEKTRQWNIGLTHGMSAGRWRTDGSVDIYINKVEDKIVSIPINMFVVRSVNMAKVMAMGTDVRVSCKYNLSRHHALGVAGNYSYQRVENRTDSKSKYYGNQIAYTPEHSGSITAYWENPWANLSITGDGMTERWTTNEHSEGTRIAGFMEWAMSAYRTIGNFTLRASITNIFNKQYDIIARYPMPGRGWKASVMYNF